MKPRVKEKCSKGKHLSTCLLQTQHHTTYNYSSIQLYLEPLSSATWLVKEFKHQGR